MSAANRSGQRKPWRAAAASPRYRLESAVPDMTAGSAMECPTAAALDLATYKALRPEESALAAARVEPDAQVSGKRCWYPPSLRFDVAAPLKPAHSKAVRNPKGPNRKRGRNPAFLRPGGNACGFYAPGFFAQEAHQPFMETALPGKSWQGRQSPAPSWMNMQLAQV